MRKIFLFYIKRIASAVTPWPRLLIEISVNNGKIITFVSPRDGSSCYVMFGVGRSVGYWYMILLWFLKVTHSFIPSNLLCKNQIRIECPGIMLVLYMVWVAQTRKPSTGRLNSLKLRTVSSEISVKKELLKLSFNEFSGSNSNELREMSPYQVIRRACRTISHPQYNLYVCAKHRLIELKTVQLTSHLHIGSSAWDFLLR